jgi:predicted nucleic acid-binding protein
LRHAQRPLDDHSQPRVRLEAEAVIVLVELCETGHFQLIASAAHEIENAQNPYPERKAHAEDLLAVATHRALTTPEAVTLASAYKQKGTKQLDALHLALAVTAGADFFCTTDDKLLRRGRRLDTRSCLVVSPLELISRQDVL